MTVRAAIYCRISDDREGGGLGVARQEADCRALAERNGWEVARVYVDNDVSAYDRRKKRQQWLAMLTALGEGQYDAVIAWHPDRLYRQTRDLLTLIDLCDKDRVRVATVTGGDVDLSTATGRAVAKTVGAWNEHESERKAERNQRKALELADAGKIGNGGPRPFGYNADRLTLHPVEAPILVGLYADVLAGKALRTMTRELHEAGVTTSTGGPWSTQGLKYTLLRARNMGWRIHKGRLAAPAVWEAVVGRETWEQAKAILTSPDRANMGQAQYVRRYLLTGLLCCGLCGAPLKPSRNADAQRFACRPEPGSGRCGGILVRYLPLEDHVVALLMARLERDADLSPALPADPTEALREQIAAEEAQLRHLAAAYAGSGDFVEMRAAGEIIRGRIAALRQQITDAHGQQRLASPLLVRDEWPGYDLAQRRTVAGQLIERIDVGPARRGLNRFDPDRLTVRWR